MLLSLMRKHAQSWIIKFLIGIIAVVFIFYFGYSFNSDDGIKVAEVNGEAIGRVEYEKAYNDMLTSFQNQYKSFWNDKLVEAFDLKNRALEGLIEQKLIAQEAEKLGITVTKAEIQKKILEIPAFLSDGRFDEGRYRAILSSNRTTPEAFEEGYTGELLQQKVAQFITTFIVPSTQDVLDNYRYANEKVKVGFVKFTPDEFMATVPREKDAISTFFDEKKENYRVPEKIKIAYIKIGAEKFSNEVTLEEEDLSAYYEDNLDMFTQEKQVKASHILFKTAPEATDEEVKKIEEKAASVLERAKKGEDFAALATEFSEDTTKSKGGDLGYFTQGRMVKEFEDAAFALEPGQISELVKTDYGYHIIKVEDKKERSVKTYEEAKAQVDSILRRNGSMDMADERARTLLDQMPYDVDLEKYAGENNEQYITTDFFSQAEPAPVIMNNARLAETLFSLEKGDLTEIIEQNNEFYIMQVTDKKESYVPKLEEVYAAVEADYVDSMALKAAKSEAEAYLKALKETGKWVELAAEKGKAIDSTDFFTREGSPEKIGPAQGLNEAAFNLTQDKPFPETVFENQTGSYVIRWEERQGIDEAKFNQEKESYTENVTNRKRQEAINDWVAKLKANAKIDLSYFERMR
ncbi:MAG: SurA N-terminal domain-containing protein [Deltaproteobacteria bacterium]|nr:SurA N-terminal domain-containing protein [Deltaproteobacteria bacterium]